jgi:hypothetical protein
MTVARLATPRLVAVEKPPSRLLDLDPELTASSLGRAEFPVRHALAAHPLLTLEALAALADDLPPGAIERHAARQPLLVPGGAPDLGGKPSETVLTIETNGRWMVLWNLEQRPAYRKLLDEILDEAEPYLPAREGRMGRRECFLFLSAPNATTPVHVDPENNFLLQIRGTKEIHVGRWPDRAWELRELDRYHDGGHRNLEAIPPLSSSFRMEPGDGVYMYPWAPHWVQNGPRASISLSITFRTEKSERHERVHRLNRRLRGWGLKPTPPGVSDPLDRAKSGTLGTIEWVRRGFRPQRGARDFS